MALAAELSRAGFGPTHLQTGASVAFEKIGEAFAITRIELETSADIPGIDDATFQKHAADAKRELPGLEGPERGQGRSFAAVSQRRRVGPVFVAARAANASCQVRVLKPLSVPARYAFAIWRLRLGCQPARNRCLNRKGLDKSSYVNLNGGRKLVSVLVSVLDPIAP